MPCGSTVEQDAAYWVEKARWLRMGGNYDRSACLRVCNARARARAFFAHSRPVPRAARAVPVRFGAWPLPPGWGAAGPPHPRPAARPPPRGQRRRLSWCGAPSTMWQFSTWLARRCCAARRAESASASSSWPMQRVYAYAPHTRTHMHAHICTRMDTYRISRRTHRCRPQDPVCVHGLQHTHCAALRSAGLLLQENTHTLSLTHTLTHTHTHTHTPARQLRAR
jgi:hypothetical protein